MAVGRGEARSLVERVSLPSSHRSWLWEVGSIGDRRATANPGGWRSAAGGEASCNKMAAAGAEAAAAAAEEEKRMAEGDPESGGDSEDEGDSDSSGDGEDEEKENEAEIQRLEEQVGPGRAPLCPGNASGGDAVTFGRRQCELSLLIRFLFLARGRESLSEQLLHVENKLRWWSLS